MREVWTTLLGAGTIAGLIGITLLLGQFVSIFLWHESWNLYNKFFLGIGGWVGGFIIAFIIFLITGICYELGNWILKAGDEKKVQELTSQEKSQSESQKQSMG